LRNTDPMPKRKREIDGRMSHFIKGDLLTYSTEFN
jgi:hypothetical protein